MGTRADFYIGRGSDATWLGSIGWDGYPDGIEKEVLNASTEDEFMKHILNIMAVRDDWTSPDMGWPWPWKDSHTTDYAYAFDDGMVWAACYGRGWFDPLLDPDVSSDDLDVVVFPDMSDRQSVTFGHRSGLTIIGGV